MSLSLAEAPVQAPAAAAEAAPPAIAYAVWHSLAWLVFANVVGLLLAILLLVPGLNTQLGEWTYGRWMPVHMNLQLYGWCSLPLVAFLFHVYGADRLPAANWCRPALWIWSTALAAGSLAWLNGHSSGKLFLDWTGYLRVLFPLALLALWALLAYSNLSLPRNLIRMIGLIILLAVPPAIYFASDPGIYPPINPDTGGPTGASQLESTLVIIAILLLLPFGLARRKPGLSKSVWIAGIVFVAEALLCLFLGRADISHHRPAQYISLGSLLVWIPLMPAFYGAFGWHPNTRRWRIAFLCWWSVLVPTGWCLFLPGVLDHFKFTDGLVAHSLLAMAGFVSALLILAMVQLLGDSGWIFNFSWSFYLWNVSVLAYVAVMFYAGWREGSNPAFTMVPGLARNTVYLLRLALGALMLVASVDWLFWASKILKPARRPA